MSYLKLRSTQFDVGWDSATDPTGGAYSAPPDLLDLCLVLRGPHFKGREGRKDGREGKGGKSTSKHSRSSKFATEYSSKQLETTLHQFCYYTFAYHL